MCGIIERTKNTITPKLWRRLGDMGLIELAACRLLTFNAQPRHS